MDLLSLLGAGGTVATRARTAALRGTRAGEAEREASVLARLKAQQEAEDRGLANETERLQQRNVLDLIRERNEPPPAPDETFGAPFEAMEGTNRVFVERGNRGTTRTLQGYTPPPKPTPRDPVTEQNMFARERGLRNDFQGEQAVKDASGVAGAATTIRGALTNPTPQGDLAAIYALVKLYDPGSVVREGEITLTQSAASLPEQVRRMYEGWTQGKKLTPQMRADLAAIADSIVTERQTQINPILQEYGRSARRWGVDSAAVAPNPLKGLGPTYTTSTGKTLRVVPP